LRTWVYLVVRILRLGPVRLLLKNVAIGNVGNVAWDPAGKLETAVKGMWA